MLRRLTLIAIFSFAFASAASHSPDALRTRRGFAWKTDHSASFDYYFEAASPAERDIEKIKRLQEESRQRVLKLLGNPSGAPRIPMFIVETNRRMKDLSGDEGNGWSNEKVIAFIWGEKVKAGGAHEDCHVLARHFWGPPHADWLNEGLAVYSDDQWWGNPLPALAKYLADRGELIPLTNIQKSGWRKQPDMITYPELGGFVKFLYEKYGLDSVRQLWQGGDGQIVRIFGKPLAVLDQEWRAAIATADSTRIKYNVR